MQIILIAAVGQNGELGLGNQLLWRLPDDLQRFKKLTMGHSIVMGRKTFESIGKPLPGRKNIVLTANQEWSAEKTTIVHDSDAALEAAKQHGAEQCFIIGGGQIYRLFMSKATQLELTEVDDAPLADTYFPVFTEDEFVEVSREQQQSNDLSYDFVRYQRA